MHTHPKFHQHKTRSRIRDGLIAIVLGLVISIVGTAVPPILHEAADLADTAGAEQATAVLTGVAEASSSLLNPAASASASLGTPFCDASSWVVSPSANSPTWHGSSLFGGLVPGGGAVDFFPPPAERTNPHRVCAIAHGTVLRTCDAGTGHGMVVIDHGPDIGKVGYVHMDTSTMVRSGQVTRGQFIGLLYQAPASFRDGCGSGSSSHGSATHLHLAFERPLNMNLGGVTFTTDRHSRDGQTVRFAGISSAAPNTATAERPTVIRNGTTRLTWVANKPQLRVCGDNIIGEVVRVRFSNGEVRGERATSRCVFITTRQHIDPSRAAWSVAVLNRVPTVAMYVPAGCANLAPRMERFCDSIPPLRTDRFVGNVSSRLTLNGDSLDLTIRANNLAGNEITVVLSRGWAYGSPPRTWTRTIRATSNSVVIRNLDGPGGLYRNVTYFTVATINNRNPHSVSQPATACFSASGGRSLCDSYWNAPVSGARWG